MRRYITLLLATLTSVVSLAQDKSVPTTAGLYYSSPSGPSRLELATNSGFKTTGVAKSAFSYGIAKAEDKNVLPVTVTRIANSNNLTIVPQTDLPAGEYLLITDAAKGADGYDFGVK